MTMVTSTKINSTPTSRKSGPAPASTKKTTKANTSILSFFKKSGNKEGSLFLGAESTQQKPDEPADPVNHDDRFNEVVWPVKRRRLSEESKTTVGREYTSAISTTQDVKTEGTVSQRPVPKVRRNAPFILESDSEEDGEEGPAIMMPSPIKKSNLPRAATTPLSKLNLSSRPSPANSGLDTHQSPTEDVPDLEPEDSAYENAEGMGEFAEFEGIDPAEFEGEEEREMRFMREQARLEAAEAAGEGFADQDFGEDLLGNNSNEQHCPICDGSLARISMDEATRHVNSCLDGNPTPLPGSADCDTLDTIETQETKIESAEISKRFARAAVPRPGQQNPFEVAPTKIGPKSAFSKLMSNNAEDSAWATAAAAEKESRGRPAYERTCPFYKIMPGFSICVDAFRYGAVEGCKAYFLSHFHSDHYIGLTANWRHGPIYCSKVTGSLVKQQLRTAAKWVVELEFEKSYDIPETGASVTMIPANHCPGSSLFLFSKPEGNSANGRVKRILHCGDFRACPAHVNHELLKPDILDAVSGKTKQQKIDICYLDTTYLNPRYSFPPQNDVIQACAELCANMSADPDCKDDVWERSAKALGTPAVSKYFQTVKSESSGKQDLSKKPRQRLLVICGTYSIGKERICLAIAKALNTKIFASPGKIKICKQLDMPELTERLTSNPLEAQVHMQMLMEIRAETLQEYLNSYKPHFSRIVGFRPSGWNFRPNGKAIAANTPPSMIQTQTLLQTKAWRTRFGYKDFVAQRGSTKEAMCFGVPYSEHSSFRELAMFVMSLRIEKIIPTVNVGSDQSRKRMKGWLDRWQAERRRGGFVQALIEHEDDENDPKLLLWDGKNGRGGGAWW